MVLWVVGWMGCLMSEPESRGERTMDTFTKPSDYMLSWTDAACTKPYSASWRYRILNWFHIPVGQPMWIISKGSARAAASTPEASGE